MVNFKFIRKLLELFINIHLLIINGNACLFYKIIVYDLYYVYLHGIYKKKIKILRRSLQVVLASKAKHVVIHTVNKKVTQTGVCKLTTLGIVYKKCLQASKSHYNQ